MKAIRFALMILLLFAFAPTAIHAENDALTPQGEIVFVSDRNDGADNLFVMRPDGSNLRQLTDGAGEEADRLYSPQWSTDGAMVAYAWQSDYILTGIDVRRADGVWLGNLFYDDTYYGNIAYIAWSPDGYTIVYDSFGVPASVSVQGFGGTISYDLDNARDASWSPDSLKLAFTVGDWSGGEIITIGRDGANQTNLTNHPANDHAPAWSPDGTKIVFASNRPGNDCLFVMNVDGSNVQQLTNVAANDSDPAWSPDGNFIAFTRTYANGNSEIFIMKANGGNQTRLTNNLGYDGQPDWKPAAQASPEKVLLLSSSSGGKVGGVTFRDEDILAYNPRTARWSLYFDGTDVGLTTDIDALSRLWDGSLVMSFNVPTTLPGLGLVDDSDLVRFVPTGLGPNTTGAFTTFISGSRLETTTDAEDIDALYSVTRYAIDFSTIGRANVSGLIAQDEDVIHYSDDSYYRYGYEWWRLFLDGSQLLLTNASEDISGFGRDGEHTYYSTLGAFAMPGLNGTGADIFELTEDPASGQLTPTMFWDGSQYGFGAEVIDALEIVYLTDLPISAADFTVDEPAEVGDEVDDVDAGEEETIIYLPLIRD